jgi:lambda repressor-like predicted transcriptional regulator
VKKKNDDLVEKYAAKIEPLLDLAKRAYGLRGQNTPAHKASEKYTSLLKEYYEKGGSLVSLASRLGVAYSGMRRRVFTSNVPPQTRKPRSRSSEETIKKSLERVLKARNQSSEDYHREIHSAYHSGISLATLSKELGLSSSAPLYYAVSCHEIKLREGK